MVAPPRADKLIREKMQKVFTEMLHKYQCLMMDVISVIGQQLYTGFDVTAQLNHTLVGSDRIMG